ncbi:MAG: 2-oxoacid:acceptor oxidoreductase subunit alpha, partial [Acetobacteraceae bacterium]
FFTRGTSKNRYAKYTEEGAAYEDNMQRLLKKFHTARLLVPAPVRREAAQPTRIGAIYYGSTAPAMEEAVDHLAEHGVAIDLLRVRGFPVHDDVAEFIDAHDQVFIVEQNRDAQLRTLLINELEIDPARLTRMLHYDGSPITARFIADAIAEATGALKVVPLRKAVP